MTCHHQGMIQKADQVRDHVEKNSAGFTPAEVATVKALYPPRKEFARLVQLDAARFRKAVEATGTG